MPGSQLFLSRLLWEQHLVDKGSQHSHAKDMHL